MKWSCLALSISGIMMSCLVTRMRTRRIGMITEITRTWFVSMLSMTRMMVVRLIPLEGFKSGAKVKHEDTITDYNLDKIGN